MSFHYKWVIFRVFVNLPGLVIAALDLCQPAWELRQVLRDFSHGSQGNGSLSAPGEDRLEPEMVGMPWEKDNYTHLGNHHWLVVWNMAGLWLSIQLGMSSGPNWLSLHHFSGWGSWPTTNQRIFGRSGDDRNRFYFMLRARRSWRCPTWLSWKVVMTRGPLGEVTGNSYD